MALTKSCESLAQITVRPLLRLYTRPLPRRVLDTTGDAVGLMSAGAHYLCLGTPVRVARTAAGVWLS